MKSVEEMKREGERLKKLREAFTLTQMAFCEKTGLSISLFRQMEGGRRAITPKTVLKIREALDEANPDYIFTGEGEPREKSYKEVVEAYERLPEEKQELIMKLMESMLRE